MVAGIFIDAESPEFEFAIGKGELVGFIGLNGAGKSTTLKILTGVLYPSEGEVDVMGFCPWKQRQKYVSHIEAVFGQKSQLVWDIPPLDSFLMNQAIYRIPKTDFSERLNNLTNMLEVQPEFFLLSTRTLYHPFPICHSLCRRKFVCRAFWRIPYSPPPVKSINPSTITIPL